MNKSDIVVVTVLLFATGGGLYLRHRNSTHPPTTASIATQSISLAITALDNRRDALRAEIDRLTDELRATEVEGARWKAAQYAHDSLTSKSLRMTMPLPLPLQEAAQ